MTGSGLHFALGYRARVLAGFALVVLVVAGIWTWSLYGPLADAVSAQQEQYLLGIARTAALGIEGADANLEAVADRLGSDTGLRITVVAPDGTVTADSEEDPALLDDHGDRPEIAAALAGEDGVSVRFSDTQDVERMYVAVPVSDTRDAAVVRVSTSLASIRDLADRTRRSGLWLLAAALALALVVAWRVAGSTAGPVERLAASARAMAAGDLASPVPSDNAALAPLSSALVDLGTQMRDRIDRLKAEEGALRLVVDGLSDAVLLLENDTVLLANRAARSLIRPAQTDPQGRTLDSVGIPASLVSAILDRLDDSAPASQEHGPDPFQRYHRILTVPLGPGESGHRTLVVLTDITDRMRLDAVRTDFVANASHELKTPTAGILLLAESADQAARDGDEDQALAFLSQIAGEAARLKHLVGDLLDLSRIETVPGVDEIADVRTAVDLAVSAHRRAAGAKNLTLKTRLDGVSGDDVAVRCGVTDLAIALDNLLSNAIAYTETGTVAVEVQADHDNVTIAVSDTGIGIPDAEIERVFERFYRVDRARSRTSGGTGLGLSLVRNVAERAGGSASIHSVEGSGTTATLILPRAL